MHLVKNKILSSLLVALICLSISSGTKLVKRQVDNQKKVVCYYANWAVYRQGLAKFSPQNINPYLCTHLIYAFGGLQKDDTIAPFDKYQDLEKSGFSHFAALKTYNKELKTMLAIGGWNEASKKFSPMVADPQRRYTFIKSAIRFLRRYNFDGVDLDWEYPTQRDGGKPQDKENYAKLIKEMREAFEREADQTGKDRLIISMAVPASLEITAEGYDVRSLDKNLDFFNILAYDYHSSLETAVNHHSPLFRIKEISEFDFRANLNIESTIKFYIGHGASPEKLVLGIPTYGRSYTLVNPDAHEIGSPTDGPGVQGNGTKEDGYLAYYEICKGIKEQKWDVVRAYPGQTGPYAHHDNFWVGYDDIDIVREKAYYVAEEGLGGIMFWTIDNDDFRGTCHNEPYPLIEAAKRALYSSTTSVKSKTSVSISTSRHSNHFSFSGQHLLTDDINRSLSDRPRSLSNNRKVTTPAPPTTPSSEPSFVCTDEGFFPHTKSCKKYYWCLEAAGIGMVAHTFTCPQGLFFNSLTDGCDFKRNVECGEKSTKEEVLVEATTTESSVASKSNDKSVQDILQEIKSAGGLEAFEEQLKEEEFEKKELKQRTKDRNDDISSKTRNRFTKLLERKKPKESESTSSQSSSSSQEKKQPNSFLSRLANRRRNNNNNSKPSSTSSSIITESPSTTPLTITSSFTTNPPARSGLIRNRNRPSFLRKQPTVSSQPDETIPEEDNEIVPPETPRNSLKKVQRNSFLNRGASLNEKKSGLGKAEPVKISSDSFRPKISVPKEEKLKVIKIDDQTPDLITEGTPTLLQRSRDSERKFKFSSVQNRGLPPRLTNSSATDFSRNLAYVTIDRSQGKPKLSDDIEPVIPSQGRAFATTTTEEAPRDRENTVRDLEYVTIQRGVPSRKKQQSQVGFGISNEISNRGAKHPRGRRSVSSASETVSLVFPSSPFIDLIPPSSNNDNVKYVYPNYIRTNRQVTSSSTSPVVDPVVIDEIKENSNNKNSNSRNENQDVVPDSSITILPSTTTLTPEATSTATTTFDPITTTILTSNIFDEENIYNITVFKTISETLRLPFSSLFRPQPSEQNSIKVKRVTVSPTSFVNNREQYETATKTVDNPFSTTTNVSTTTFTETTTTMSQPSTTTSTSTTTTINKIQALINQRKQSGKKSFFLNKSRKEFESTNEINDSKSSSSSSSTSNSFKSPSFKRPNLRAKFPRISFGKIELTPSTTQQSSVIPDTTTFKPATTTTERNGFVKPSRPTNRLFNKFISRGTIGKLSKEDKTKSTSSDSITATTPIPLVTTQVTRSTLRSFIPTRSFPRRPSIAFKPIDLSAAPSKKSISKDRSSSLRRSNLFTEPTTSPITTTPLSVVPETTEKLTVGKILANLHGESTEKPESSSLRPKSFKPKFQRNKLREKLHHQLQEQQDVNNLTTEEPETTTNLPKSSLPGIRINNRITPRRHLPRPSSKITKSQRDLTTKKPKSSAPSRFQPTPRRNFRNRFSPTVKGFARNNPKKNVFSSQLPSVLSTTTESSFTVTEPVVKVLSNADIAEKLGLIPTPIPIYGDDEDDESINIIDSTTLSPVDEKDILVGLFNSQSQTESPSSVPTERNSVKSLLQSAIVSSAIPKQEVDSSTKRFVPFFPKPLPLRASTSEEDETSNAGKADLNNFVQPISRSSASFASRRQKNRGRKIKRRRGPSASSRASTTDAPQLFIGGPTVSPRTVPKRQFSRRPNFFRQKNIRNRFTSNRETTTLAPGSSELVVEEGKESENQVSQNEIEPKFRRRRPDFQRRRNNIGKLSIKNITDTGRDSDFDLDNNIINKTTTTTPTRTNENEDDFATKKERATQVIQLKNDSNLYFKTTPSTANFTPTEVTSSILTSYRATPTRATTIDTTASSILTTLKSVKKAESKKRKKHFDRRRRPSNFTGFRRGPNKEIEHSELGETSTTPFLIVKTNTPLSDIETVTATTNVFDKDYETSRIERRSTISNLLNQTDSTTESYTLSSVSEHSFTTNGDDFKASLRTTAQPSTSLTTKKSLLFSRNRSNFFKSRFNPPKTQRKQSKLGDVDGKSSTIEVATVGPSSTTLVPLSTTPGRRSNSKPTIVTTPSTPRRSFFNSALKRPKLPFFQKRKNSPKDTKDIIESQTSSTLATGAAPSTASTTTSSSFSTESLLSSNRTASYSPTPQSTSTSSPSTSPILQNTIKTSSSLRESEQRTKSRFSFKFSKQKAKSPISSFSRFPQKLSDVSSFSELDNSINTDMKVAKKESETEEVDHNPLEEEGSVEDVGSLEGRLQQRLQQRKIKTQRNRNSLFKTSRRPSFIRPRKPVTTESSVFIPTITNTQDEEEVDLKIIDDPHVFITTTETATTQSTSTSRPHQKLRPINLSPSPNDEVDPLQNDIEPSSTRSYFNPTSPSPSRNRFRPKVNQSPAPGSSPSSTRNRIQPQDVQTSRSSLRNRFNPRNNYSISRTKPPKSRFQPQGQFPAPGTSISSPSQNLTLGEDQSPAPKPSNPSRNRIQIQDQFPASQPSSPIPFRNRIQIQDQSPANEPSTPLPSQNSIQIQDQSPEPNTTPSSQDNKFQIRGQFPALRPSTPSPFENRIQIQDQFPEPDTTPSPLDNKSQIRGQFPALRPSTPSPVENRIEIQDQLPKTNLLSSPQDIRGRFPALRPSNLSLFENDVLIQNQSPEPKSSPLHKQNKPQIKVQSPSPRPSTPSPLRNRFRPRDQSLAPRPSTPSPLRNKFQPQDQSPTPRTSNPSPLRNRFQPRDPSSFPRVNLSRNKFPPQEQFSNAPETSPSKSRFEPQEQSPDAPKTSPSPSRSRFQPQQHSPDALTTSPSPLNRRFQPQEQSPDAPKTSSSPSRSRLHPQQQSSNAPTTSPSPSNSKFQPQQQSPDAPKTSPSPSRSRFQPQQHSPDAPKPSPSPSRSRFQPQKQSTNASETFPLRNRFQSRNRSSKVPETSPNILPTVARTNKFQQQPRRLDVFRNRFQVSPSSPRPIISKTKEEELFSHVQQQNTLPISDIKDSHSLISDVSRESVTTASTTTDLPPQSTLQVTTKTTTTTTSKPRFIMTSPARKFPPSSSSSPQNGASRFRSKPVNRSRPRARTTTTTTPKPEYEYYYDEEYPGEENGIGKLKSVDPVYDYELTPLTNKVAITSEGIECYDVGVFPHPGSCKKFITCSRRTSVGRIVGWEYECPIYLAFDPIGGRCNWAADVDCS